jgi:predicted acylesterase/phospholipase RssA
MLKQASFHAQPALLPVMKALVLSGGGGFGAYQVGVWRALLESGWQPDIVLGTSIGAVNAFLVSRGTTAEELRQVWVEIPAQLPQANGGVRFLPYSREVPRFRAWTAEVAQRFGAQPLRCRLQVCVAELCSGAMRVVEGEGVTARHLLAACALPAVMLPVRVDGRLCVDGGTLYPVPLKEAVASGATEIIAVDLFHGTPCNAVRALRLTTLWIRNRLRGESHLPSPQEMAGVRLRIVGHPRSLGTVRECLEWNAGRVERLIETGYRDTVAAFGSQLS